MTTLADSGPRRPRWTVVLTLLLLLGLLASRYAFLAEHDVVTLQGPTMGTRYTVRCVTTWGRPDTEGLQSAIDDRLGEINLRMSTYLRDSELSRFNRHEGTDWFEVSPETATVVQYALEVARQTDGAFDPTVGPLVNLWGFGPTVPRVEPPNEEAIENAMENVGYKHLEVRLEPPALRKTIPNLEVDLSAIAKGYAVDAVGNLLSSRGFNAYMVEIGGEVLTRGTKPGGLKWQIGIEKPNPEGRSIQQVLELEDEAVATSGDYRNFFEHNGRRYSHTIDPTTGRPVKHSLATVTVRADSCIAADAWATALLVLGPERGVKLANEKNLAALLMVRNGDQVPEETTKAW